MMLFSALRQTIRGLVRRRGFSSLAILTLAVGIGSTTAVYSLLSVLAFSNSTGSRGQEPAAGGCSAVVRLLR